MKSNDLKCLRMSGWWQGAAIRLTQVTHKVNETMNQLKEIYNLISDDRLIRLSQDPYDRNLQYTIKEGGGLLFGTKEWFREIVSGLIDKCVVKGVISRVYMSGHNDYPEFEIENSESKTTWTRLGIDKMYQVGKRVELTYVDKASKRPLGPLVSIPPIIIQIKIAE